MCIHVSTLHSLTLFALYELLYPCTFLHRGMNEGTLHSLRFVLSDAGNNRGDLSSRFFFIGNERRRLISFPGLLREAHQDGFEVAVEKVLERRQEVDGGALDQFPARAADLLLRLATFDQSVAWKREARRRESPDWTQC